VGAPELGWEPPTFSRGEPDVQSGGGGVPIELGFSPGLLAWPALKRNLYFAHHFAHRFRDR
jgi:hypothetical protein